jgi:hypothetical protein
LGLIIYVILVLLVATKIQSTQEHLAKLAQVVPTKIHKEQHHATLVQEELILQQAPLFVSIVVQEDIQLRIHPVAPIVHKELTKVLQEEVTVTIVQQERLHHWDQHLLLLVLLVQLELIRWAEQVVLLVQLEAIKIKLDHQVVNPVQLEAIKIKLDHQVVLIVMLVITPLLQVLQVVQHVIKENFLHLQVLHSVNPVQLEPIKVKLDHQVVSFVLLVITLLLQVLFFVQHVLKENFLHLKVLHSVNPVQLEAFKIKLDHQVVNPVQLEPINIQRQNHSVICVLLGNIHRPLVQTHLLFV